jgi:malate dehydrogenase (oxaloacetate-decarboxylating)
MASKKKSSHANDMLALALHKKHKGKISVQPKIKIKRALLQQLYTPGVAAVSRLVAAEKNKTNDYTWRGNTVAVISDGSAVLGLGNIGPEGALPVMEGKAYLFKALAGIDAVPIVLNTQDTEEIIATVRALEPSFAAINLEDIAAPRCFEIEKRLRETLAIPVMHDDQQGTAVVVLAGVINALKVVGKKKQHVRVVVVGAGAAGSACVAMLRSFGVKDIFVVDRKGIITANDPDAHKQMLARQTNKEGRTGSIADAFVGVDIMIGVSGPGIVTEDMVRSMARDAIVFAMANPTPEIMPELARRAGAAVIATGRSDFPNQINNSLGFPGIFRGALDAGVTKFDHRMFVRAAENLAKLVAKPTAKLIIPDPLDTRVVTAVGKAIHL